MSSPIELSILGSTGSIGCQTFDVVRENPATFSVIAISAGRNVELAAKQVEEFRPRLVSLQDEESASRLVELLKGKLSRSDLPEVDFGDAGIRRVVSSSAQIISVGISGFAAFAPVLYALECGKHLALANKECFVAGQELFRRHVERSASIVVPVDSEHNSIYQCLLRRGRRETVRRIVLTASGGPFLNTPIRDLADVTPEMAVRHPRWSMGAKISVDSATLMNKALEVIEAAVLFQLPPEKVEVLIHPESVVHGLVEYEEGTVLAALYEPDMKVPIAYAMKLLAEAVSGGSQDSLERNVRSGHSLLNLGGTSGAGRSLRFLHPDEQKFPALGLAYQALQLGTGAGAVLNAANEVAVSAFLAGKIRFPDIVPIAGRSLAAYKDSSIASAGISNFSDIILVDSWGRKFASELLDSPDKISVSKRGKTQIPSGSAAGIVE